MPTDHDRRELYQALEHQLGRGPAGTLMELLPQQGWGDVARRSDLALLRTELISEISAVRTDLTSEIRGLRAEFGQLRSEVGSEIGGLRAEVNGRFAEMNGRIDSMAGRMLAGQALMATAIAGVVIAAAQLL